MVLNIAPNSLKRFHTLPFGRFWAETLGYTPWFWTGSILASWKSAVPTPSFFTAGNYLCPFQNNSQGSKIGRFQQKPWAIANGFEHGRFWQVLEIAPNSLKWFQSPIKRIFNCFGDSLCRFRVNSEESKFGRFWAKTLDYSPCFWTWSIFAILEIAPNSLKRFQSPPKLIFNCFGDLLCRFTVNLQEW